MGILFALRSPQDEQLEARGGNLLTTATTPLSFSLISFLPADAQDRVLQLFLGCWLNGVD